MRLWPRRRRRQDIAIYEQQARDIARKATEAERVASEFQRLVQDVREQRSRRLSGGTS